MEDPMEYGSDESPPNFPLSADNADGPEVKLPPVLFIFGSRVGSVLNKTQKTGREWNNHSCGHKVLSTVTLKQFREAIQVIKWTQSLCLQISIQFKNCTAFVSFNQSLYSGPSTKDRPITVGQPQHLNPFMVNNFK